MEQNIEGNIVLAHGGAPTAVINASLYGSIRALKSLGFRGKILAARYGSKGLYHGDFIDLTNIGDEALENLKNTPGTAIGSSRFPLYEKEYAHIVDLLKEKQVRYVLFTGGNGSMDTLGHLTEEAAKKGVTLYCGGVPKTIDNDLGVTDHAPGFPSAANYVVQTVRDCIQDVKGLPIHVCVIEIMGRNAGWLTAASECAFDKDASLPHLTYVPEIPFDEDCFLRDVKAKWELGKGVIVCCSEGLKGKDGKPIAKPIYQTERATYFGDVSSHLAQLIVQKLGIKSRSEKPGLIQRCSSALASDLDREEAILMGQLAAQAVLEKKTGFMVGIKRISSSPYRAEPILIPVKEVMMKERTFPLCYVKDGNTITQEYEDWLRPLLNPKKQFVSFLD